VNAAKSPVWQVSSKQRSRARTLRRDSTDAERLYWNQLRAHRPKGAGFRRQTPVGCYIVDFVCHAASLIVELDGGQHFEENHIKRDARRDAFLAAKGFRVLRFNNNDVMINRQGVLETIAAAIAAPPTPTLSCGRGGKQAAARGDSE
jgi:very-short-patch-repair endonuclease